jgi:hypothetical protein
MRQVVKVAAWTVAFVAAAGAGAFVAANTNPFPPGVDRPGEGTGGSPRPTTTPSPEPDRWRATLRSFTFHELYVGGRCVSRWSGELRFSIDPDGRAQGVGRARLRGDLDCDFPIAQVQAKAVSLEVRGLREGERLELRLVATGTEPTNAGDYGGLIGTMPLRFSVRVASGAGSERVEERRVDEQGRGRYESSSRLRVLCTNCPV